MEHLVAGVRRGGKRWEERQAHVFFSKSSKRPQETQTKCGRLHHHLLRSAPLTSPAPGLVPHLPPQEPSTTGLSPPNKPRLLSTDGSLPSRQLWPSLLLPVGPSDPCAWGMEILSTRGTRKTRPPREVRPWCLQKALVFLFQHIFSLAAFQGWESPALSPPLV